MKPKTRASENRIATVPVPLESVLCTEELQRRPSRPPDYRAENRALLALAEELTNSPGSVLQRLVDTALELCRGHSAGVSLLEKGPPGDLNPRGDHFRWHAVAGAWSPLVWDTTTSRDHGPCGTVFDRNTTLLFANAHLHYAQFAEVHPLMVEGMLVPFRVAGRPVGAVWVIAHDDSRKFDGEDQRLLESLATFAAIAYQARLAISAQEISNEALREADRRKSELMTVLAHELRNPLAPIRNAVEILHRWGGDEHTVKPATEMMKRQVGHMVRLVDDLFDMGRISRGKIELRREPVELASIVHHAVEGVRSLCDSMDQQLTVTLPPEPIYLNADAIRLAQVVGNLLNNACKFTDRGREIRLSVEREAEQVVIRVEDAGIGIVAEHLPHIFDMFMQADTSLERSRDGLGVGLALVKNLVEMHEGTVVARSAGLGQGTEFVVRLPVLSGSPPALAGKHSEVTAPAVVPRRILVVDDNRDAAETLAMLLKLSGHEVDTAHDGLEAVKGAATLEPEVILLDIGLPGLNGYEAARRIRQQQPDKPMTLVALTGWDQQEDRRRSAEAGFDAHMVKPVDFAALTKLLAECDTG